MPAQGSSDGICANSSADFNMRSMPAAEKSLEYVEAARCPKNTRTPIDREPASFSVSTCPSRTTVENSSPSRTTHSAAEAPPCMARRTTSVARNLRSVAVCGFASRIVVIIRIQTYHGGTEPRRKPYTWPLHDKEIASLSLRRDNPEAAVLR